MTPAEARARRMTDRAQWRNIEANDAMDFLFMGDDEGRHRERCVHAEPCSRNYDPLPYPEAEPHDTRLYDGTGIGALYGAQDSERHLWQLAGWNLVPRSTR
jgi:hypothetical protein